MAKVDLTDEDFSDCDLDQLVELKRKLQSALEKRELERIDTFRQQILAISETSGVALLELVKPLLEDQVHFVKKRRLPSALPVLYCHPENSTWTWTGRGRKPLWITDWISKGGQLDALFVDEKKSK